MSANASMKNLSEVQNWRLNILAAVFGVVAILLFGQVIRIQVSPFTEEFAKQGQDQMGYYRRIVPARGFIYDRWGRILAGNTMVYEVGVELRDVSNPDTIARTLSTVLGRDYGYYYGAASRKYSLDPENPAVYVVLDNSVTQEQKAEIDKIKADIEAYSGRRSKDSTPPSLRGLVFRPQLVRSYPERELASNVIGFVNTEGDGYGVEKRFHELLSGNPLVVWVPLDPNRVTEIPHFPQGTSLVLTLDREIQVAMERVADKAMEDSGATSATILVMDPTSGEMLAMAMTPRMDLNQYGKYGDVFTGNTPFNRAVSQAYEPGSVFKIFTLAAAMDAGVVDTETIFNDGGSFNVGGINIVNWNRGAWGPQTMQGCMQHSLNVCLAWMAVETGATTFYNYMDAFGFGRSTGIEIAAENRGRLKMPGDEDWFMSDLGTNSFGQAIAVTPVQMMMAASALANEGRMMAPHIVRARITNDHQYNTPLQIVGTPISRETARTVTELLATSLENESSGAKVPGYRLAGKTGTAQIPTPFGYDPNETNASFIGWGPVDDPRFIVYVWLERPKSSTWASIVAAPVFAEAVNELVVLLNLPPDDLRHQLEAAKQSQ